MSLNKPILKLNANCFNKTNEEEWYNFWLKSDFFSSYPKSIKTPYVILMPPPNITGILHMGHLLNVTIQDILARRARMLNKEVCWIPGTDHASIATEVKVLESLKKQGIEKKDLTKEEFLKYAWEWKDKHEAIIINQLKRIGISCDWKRKKFTLDKNLSLSVTKTFINFYEKGYIYKSNRIINWDSSTKTAISDDEVIYKEVKGKLYFIKYLLTGTNEYLTIATTRPETIMGDTALCVHPDDERYKRFIGKNALVPLVNRLVPIIADKYVQKDFGTGCLKVTPAHDINDAELGLKYNLETINIFNEDGTLNNEAKIFIGQDRLEARNNIIEKLKEEGLIEKIKDYNHNIGFSERTNEIIEPRISTQWFLKMKEFIKPALESVLKENIKFYPKKYINLFKVWMENTKDWCISRQLWWGHQIPAYYLPDGNFVVAKNKDEALIKAKKNLENIDLSKKDLIQDPDVLDTWFSSALWPMTVFDGINNPDNEDINYYYPTDALVTAPEIIFFWVARMIMMGYKLRNNKPFKNVYFTGIVRDSKKRKMSKSLGNSPDLISLIDKYGVDGVRSGIIFSSPAGNDLIFNEKLCEQGRNFANKIWNAFKLIQSFKPIETSIKKKDIILVKWFHAKYNSHLRQINKHYENFKISEILIKTYKLFFDDFCSIFLEGIKPKNKEIPKQLYDHILEFFEKQMIIINPFMPFITENVWQQLKNREYNESLVTSIWPTLEKYNETLLKNSEKAFDLISKIRNFRKEKSIPIKTKLNLLYDKKSLTSWLIDFEDIIIDLTNISLAERKQVDIQKEDFFNLIIHDISLFIDTSKLNITSIYKEKDRIKEELKYYQEFLNIVDKKLSNESFIQHAPNKIIQNEIKKKKDIIKKIEMLQNSISKN